MRIKRAFVPITIELETESDLNHLVQALTLLGRYEEKLNANSFLTSRRDPSIEVKYVNNLIQQLKY